MMTRRLSNLSLATISLALGFAVASMSWPKLATAQNTGKYDRIVPPDDNSSTGTNTSGSNGNTGKYDRVVPGDNDGDAIFGDETSWNGAADQIDKSLTMTTEDFATANNQGNSNNNSNKGGSSGGAGGANVVVLNQIVATSCGTAKCHQNGGYQTLDALKKTDAASRIQSGNMPMGSKLSDSDRQALLNALR